MEHQVWGIFPGKKKRKFIAAFDLDKWQFAQKLCALLEDKGFTKVEIILAEENSEEEE